MRSDGSRERRKLKGSSCGICFLFPLPNGLSSLVVPAGRGLLEKTVRHGLKLVESGRSFVVASGCCCLAHDGRARREGAGRVGRDPRAGAIVAGKKVRRKMRGDKL